MNHSTLQRECPQDGLAPWSPRFSRGPSEAATDTGRWWEVLGPHPNQCCSPCSCFSISCLCRASLLAQMAKKAACSTGDPDSISGLGRSAGEGNGYPLQYSCLKNSMNREALWGPFPLQRLRRSPTLGIGGRKGTWHP